MPCSEYKNNFLSLHSVNFGRRFQVLGPRTFWHFSSSLQLHCKPSWKCILRYGKILLACFSHQQHLFTSDLYQNPAFAMVIERTANVIKYCVVRALLLSSSLHCKTIRIWMFKSQPGKEPTLHCLDEVKLRLAIYPSDTKLMKGRFSSM